MSLRPSSHLFHYARSFLQLYSRTPLIRTISHLPEDVQPKRGPGRPRKSPVPSLTEELGRTVGDHPPQEAGVTLGPKKRGRPRIRPLYKTHDGQKMPPRRSPGPFVLFLVEQHKLRRASGQPTLNPVRDYAKEIGAKWAALTIEEKQPYYERSEAKKAEYLKARGEYWDGVEAMHLLVRTINKQRVQHNRRKIRSHRTGTSKNPINSYSRFAEEVRANPEMLPECPEGMTVKEKTLFISSHTAKLWKELSPEEKAKYEEATRQAVSEWRTNTANRGSIGGSE